MELVQPPFPKTSVGPTIRPLYTDPTRTPPFISERPRSVTLELMRPMRPMRLIWFSRLLHAVATTGMHLKVWGGYWEFLGDGRWTPRRHLSLRQLADGSHQLFAQLEHVPQSFRLRATALSLIEAAAASLRQDENPMDGDVEEQEVALENELGAQETALADDFLHRAEAACRSRSPDLITWENLSQDVYSVGLLERFLGDTGRLSPRLADAVACIHIHRGLVSQQGRQLAYRHGHYRFLKYLAELTKQENEAQAVREQIKQKRATELQQRKENDAYLLALDLE